MNNSIFLNLGFYAACWAHFMYHQELWPTSVGHPVSSFNSSLDFAGGKHHQKIIIPIFRHVLQNFAIPGCFPYNSYCYIFYLLSSDWFVFAVCGSISVQGRGKTTTVSALNGEVLDFSQIQDYLLPNMSRSQLYLAFGHFGRLPSFFVQ